MTDQQQKAHETTKRSRDRADFREAEQHAADSPTDLSRRDWKAVAKRAFAEFGDDRGTDLAAALTYYAMMSIAPMLLALTSLLGVVGQGGATTAAIESLGGELGLKPETLATATGYVDSMQDAGGGGVLLVVGVLASLWSASNYVNAFSRMMNAVYEVQEGRPVWKLRPWLLLLTLVITLTLVAIVLSVTLSGGLSEAIFGYLGLSEQATFLWNIFKWPVIVVVVVGVIDLLYWGTPNVRQPKFRWISPGAILALAIAVTAAAGFGFYAANFGKYNATYGALGGVIVLLLMIWLINIALVLGAELDAELERARELSAGIAAEESIQLPPRDARGTAKKAAKSAAMVQEARELRMVAAAARQDQSD